MATAVKDETDEADDAENDAATLASATVIGVETLTGLDGAAGGGEVFCESSCEWGLIMCSDTDEADEESMLMVLFEFVGENWSLWFIGL